MQMFREKIQRNLWEDVQRALQDSNILAAHESQSYNVNEYWRPTDLRPDTLEHSTTRHL